MCSNRMKSDRGCDGSCVVDDTMYKKVMDAIERRIQPTTRNDKVDCEHTECNNCVNHKYCDYESNNSEIPTGSTTKNNLVVDPIDRVELLRAMNTWDKFGYSTRYGLERLDKDDKGFVPYVKYDDMLKCVKGMPSVTLQEPRWIPVSERLPHDRDWYLGIFKETDTGWINPLPYICDYVGRETKATTKEYWILRGFTDIDNACDYYKNLECVAWMPLPGKYKPESEAQNE